MKKTKDKKWSKEEDDFLIKNNSIERKIVAEQLNRSLSSVMNRYRYLDLKRPRTLINETQKEWSEEEIEFIKKNYDKYSYAELGKKINRTRNAVQCKVMKLGLKKDKIQKFNEYYFDEINSNDKAYWLGFIYADGWVEQNKENRTYCLGIELSEKDSFHLTLFNKWLNGNVVVSNRERTVSFDNNKYIVNSTLCNIKYYSKHMIESLSKYNIVPNKTYKKCNLPNIPKEYMISFLHGYFDGDGSFFLKNKKRKYYAFNYTSYNKDILEDIRKYLYENYNISSYIYLSKNNSNVWQLIIASQKDVKIFAELLLNDNVVFLKRKNDLIKEYIATLNK